MARFACHAAGGQLTHPKNRMRAAALCHARTGVSRMAFFTVEVESRPSGRIHVSISGDADYPDALDDLIHRAREVHRDALADWKLTWAPDGHHE